VVTYSIRGEILTETSSKGKGFLLNARSMVTRQDWQGVSPGEIRIKNEDQKYFKQHAPLRGDVTTDRM